ncbi:esterase/lipase family protein [Micromonospora sp. RP3T]|uniref:esterase/lipase family protein n=1 Tax=Micromonospora sp. RP3T TaxID=2135446 RepID=UPI003D72E4D5
MQPLDDLTLDAVIVLPGIMGSELYDVQADRQIWGFRDPRWYGEAWRNPETLSRLALDDNERAGAYGRVRATNVLQFPAFAPMLRGFEPYRVLLDRIGQMVLPGALRVFPYDWRLPVAHNARLLADDAARHLADWRRRGHPQARLVLVGHSMGGLVARYWTDVLGGADDVRTTVTLGTPFGGAVKAAEILAAGRGVPGFRTRRLRTALRSVAVTMPGVYDLLPTGPVVVLGDERMRELSTVDIVDIGGDRDLAEDARRRRPASGWTDRALRTVVGTGQTTAQNLRIVAGEVRTSVRALRRGRDGTVVEVDRSGDATVARDAASPVAQAHCYLAQTHGGLPASAEVAHHVANILSETPLTQPLGLPEPGLDLPDVVPAGTEFAFRVTGVEHPRDAAAWFGPVDGRTGPLPLPGHFRDGEVWVGVPPCRPGLHRVAVRGVTELVLVDAAENEQG